MSPSAGPLKPRGVACGATYAGLELVRLGVTKEYPRSDQAAAPHYLGVAAYAAELYRAGLLPVLVKFDDYVQSMGSEKLVVDMLVGDLQRVIEYPKLGFSMEQNVPVAMVVADERLLAARFDSRLFTPGLTR